MDETGRLDFDAQAEPEQEPVDRNVPKPSKRLHRGELNSIRVEDFDEMSPLVKAYELQPGKFYLLIVEGKGFSYEAAHKMLEKVREYHPDINLFIQVVAKDQKVKVAEKKQEHDTSISP